MSWSRSSRLGLVAIVLLVLVAAVGVASAVSVTDEQAPEEAEVGQEVTVAVELQDLYAEESSWEVNGQTELEDAEWTIELYQGDQLLDTYESSGTQPDPVTIDQGASDAPDRVVVEITGSVPAVEEYSYDSPATFLGGEVVQVIGGGSDVNYLSEQQIHHYTTGDPGSAEARTALDEAGDAIESAEDDGTDVSEARSTFDDAVTAYDGGDFADAVSFAEDAESQAQSSDSGSDDGSGDGGSTDGSSDGGSTDGGSDDGSSGDGSDADDSQTDDSGAGSGSGDGGTTNASNDGSGGSDDGGLLWIVLYGLLGLLILGGVGGGAFWYYQQLQGPSRDPLG